MNSMILTNSLLPTQTYTHAHTLTIIPGCHPSATLRSTNTHGTQKRKKESEQGGASGYYTWTKVLYCCTLKCGLSFASDTM